MDVTGEADLAFAELCGLLFCTGLGIGGVFGLSVALSCTPHEGRLLEGYIDLLYRGADGLVVVDYKTAATSDPDVLDQRVEGYRLEGLRAAVASGFRERAGARLAGRRPWSRPCGSGQLGRSLGGPSSAQTGWWPGRSAW